MAKAGPISNRADIGVAARGVALRRQGQGRQRRGAQLVEVGGDRVAQAQRVRRVAEAFRVGSGHEAEGDALHQAGGGQGAAGDARCAAGAASAWPAAPGFRAAGTPAGTASRPRRRSTSSIRSFSASTAAQPSAALAALAGSSVGDWSRHDRRGDVVAPGRHRDGDLVGVALPHGEAQPFQRRDRLVGGDVGAAEARRCGSNRMVASRCQAGSAPAAVTVPGFAAA